MRYLETDGTERDEAWAVEQIGALDIYRTVPRPAYLLTELRLQSVMFGDDSKALTVRVLAEDGSPASGVEVMLAPGPVSGDRVSITTGPDGLARFDITGVQYRFAKPNHAPWVVMIKGPHSDADNSVGWVMAGKGQPKVWLNPTFQYCRAETPVEPPPVEPPPVVEPETPEGVQVFDREGDLRDWAWFVQNYGSLTIQAVDGPGYRLTEVWEHAGPDGAPPAFRITVLDAVGQPVRGVAVGRWWPGAEPSEFVDLPASLHGWHDRGVWALTESDGTVEFGLGGGDYYWPPAAGPSQIWVAGSSDVVLGFGMLGGTNHHHFDAVVRWIGAEPAPDKVDTILAKLDRIIGLLEGMTAPPG